MQEGLVFPPEAWQPPSGYLAGKNFAAPGERTAQQDKGRFIRSPPQSRFLTAGVEPCDGIHGLNTSINQDYCQESRASFSRLDGL